MALLTETQMLRRQVMREKEQKAQAQQKFAKANDTIERLQARVNYLEDALEEANELNQDLLPVQHFDPVAERNAQVFDGPTHPFVVSPA